MIARPLHIFSFAAFAWDDTKPQLELYDMHLDAARTARMTVELYYDMQFTPNPHDFVGLENDKISFCILS